MFHFALFLTLPLPVEVGLKRAKNDLNFANTYIELFNAMVTNMHNSLSQ